MKTVFIGAGSHFGWTLSRDLLSSLSEGTLALCDIDQGRLAQTEEFVRKTIARHGLPTTLVSSTDREQLLPGADFVVLSIAVGGQAYAGEPYLSEISIPRRYGIDQSVGDTIGVGGVFRFLRSAPVIMEICRDMERLCPDALLLNYTNPMGMLTAMIGGATGVKNIGLCHSVQNTNRQLSEYIGVDQHETDFLAAGINHQAWFLRFQREGVDLYPQLRSALENQEVFASDPVRFEMMRHFGYFVTESSRHMSEYLPYFRRDQLIRDRFRIESRDVPIMAPPGELPERFKERFRELGFLAEDGSILAADLEPSHEYAAGIMGATMGEEPFRFNGNVMNTGLITNLPAGCCVEVPCTVDALGIHPHYVGELPPQLAAVNRTHVNVIDLAVRAFLGRNRDAAFHACAVDPLTAAVLPLARIREMFDELWDAEGDLLDYFEDPV